MLGLFAAALLVAASAFVVQLALRALTPGHAVAALDVTPAPLAPVTVDPAVLSPVTTRAPMASPAVGTTGTAELPPLPADAADLVSADPGAGTIVPARAFPVKGIAAVDRARALECLAAAIYYEAASESDDGQRAVAQVVLNRVRHPAFPATVCGVVYQGSERRGCQFSFACDGAMARLPSRVGWARAVRNAAAALAGYVYGPVGLATHYHTYAVTPSWNRTLVMTDAIGAHFFHRWKGYWGTPAAFSQRYRGGEPVPGPHAPVTQGTVASVAALPARAADALMPPTDVPASMTPPPATTPVPAIQPEHRGSGQPLSPYRDNDEGQVLDRWKDSGKPIR